MEMIVNIIVCYININRLIHCVLPWIEISWFFMRIITFCDWTVFGWGWRYHTDYKCERLQYSNLSIAPTFHLPSQLTNMAFKIVSCLGKFSNNIDGNFITQIWIFERLLVALSLLVINQEVSSRSLRSLLEPGIVKREMTPQGFYGDTFSDGFGGFRTMKKSEPNQDIEANFYFIHSRNSNYIRRSICLEWKNCMEDLGGVREPTRDRSISNYKLTENEGR